MRYVLLCALSLGVALIGFFRASLLSGRKKLLDAFIASLTQLDLIIGYQALPLSDAAEKLAKLDTAVTCFWRELSKSLRGLKPVSAAWGEAMEAAKKENPTFCTLTQADCSVLADYAAGLGGSDRETQSRNTRLAIERLRPLTEQAGDLVQKRGKMYRSLGVLGAMAIFILLM